MAKKRDEIPEPDDLNDDIPMAEGIDDADLEGIDFEALGEEPALAELAEPVEGHPDSVVDLDLPEIVESPSSGTSAVAWADLVEAEDGEELAELAPDSSANLLSDDDHPSSVEVVDLNAPDVVPLADPVSGSSVKLGGSVGDDIPLADPISASGSDSGSVIDLAALVQEPASSPSGSEVALAADVPIDPDLASEPPSSLLADFGVDEPTLAEEVPVAAEADDDVIDETVLFDPPSSPSSRDIVEQVESGLDLGEPEEALIAEEDVTAEAEAIDLSDEPAVAEDEVDLGGSGEMQFVGGDEPAYTTDDEPVAEVTEDMPAKHEDEFDDDMAAEEVADEALVDDETQVEDAAAALFDEPEEAVAEDAETTMPFEGEAGFGDEEFEAAEALNETPPDEEAAEAVDEDEVAAMMDGAEEEGLGEPVEEMASAEEDEDAPAEAVEEDEDDPKKKKKAQPKEKKKGSGALAFVGGGVLGVLLTGGTLFGLGAAGVLKDVGVDLGPLLGAAPTKPVGGGGQNKPPAPVITVVDVQKLLGSGDVEKAVEQFRDVEAKQADPEDLQFRATRGQMLLMKSLTDLVKGNKAPTKAELEASDDIKKAREDLEAAKDTSADAAYWLGFLTERTEGRDKARAVYQAAQAKFPKDKRFEAALNSLDRPADGPVSTEPPMNGTSLPRLSNGVAALLLIAQQPPDEQPPMPQPPMPQPPEQPEDETPQADKEAGFHFWSAVKLAQKHDYAEAIKALKEARRIHDMARYAKLRKSQNPLTDPTENIFLTTCDELLAYWQTRQQLVDAGLLDKAKVNEGKSVSEALAKATEAAKAATDLQTKLTASETALAEAKKKVTDTEKTLTETMTKLTDSEKKVTDTVTKLTDTEKKLTEAATAISNATKALKLTGSEETDIAKAIEKLDATRKAVEADLKSSNDLLDSVKSKLVERNYLQEAAKRADVAGALDRALNDANHPVVAAISKVGGDLSRVTGTTGKPLQKAYDDAVKAVDLSGRLVKTEAEVMKLGGELRERWTPGQMLDVWTSLLQNATSKELAERALKDVQRVNNAKPTAEAVYVKALAEKSQGQYDACRATLKGLLEDPSAGSEELRMRAKAEYKKITEPGEYYVPTALKASEKNDQAAALAAIDEALKIFPPDNFPKESAALLAVRSAMTAEQAAELPPEKRDQALEACVKDAEQAAKAGQQIEAHYALGKVNEVRREYDLAQKHYETALGLLEAAKKAAGDLGDEAVRAANPASDISGNRYHWARGRAILKNVRREAEPDIVPVPKTTPPPVDGEKPTGLDGAQSLHFGGWRAWLVMEVVAADEPMPVPANPTTDPRAEELMQSAEKLLAAKDNRGYLLKGQALALQGKWTEGLRTYVMGLELVLKDKDHAEGMKWLMDNHPAFKRPDPVMPPDVGKAEERYARGLRFYFSGRYADAEVELKEAARLNDFDPKAVFFLGLTQLQQKRTSEAEETFRLASRIEQRMGPQAKADVSLALERVQGPARKVLNAVREKAGQPGGL